MTKKCAFFLAFCALLLVNCSAQESDTVRRVTEPAVTETPAVTGTPVVTVTPANNETTTKAPSEGFTGYFTRFYDYVRKLYDGMRNFWGTSNDSSKYPPNFNSTKEEVVVIDGKKYLKQKTVYKKTDNDSLVSL